ncbi:AAA family ATPase [Thermoactinomyces daqus]|uniref:AAA family ATPase n=1 Tax=Thermoactinomyces daqus TaxID=1329516 RepID=A0A7W1X8H5_9BACL|nr:AAA family ATPase [Thermoactinomyces daqus]MBA4542043.1 AAA family ATPase [Thermoactinomyces daqus]
MIKIGLVGEAGAGKDTAAAYLCANYGLYRLAFADRMKWYFGMMHGLIGTVEEIRELVDARKERAALISYGQAYREAYGEDVWIEELFRDMDACWRWMEPAGFVVTDIRQQNELDALRERGFVIVRVTAPLDVRIERMKERGDDFDPSFMRHHTETFAQTVEPDFEIDNGGKWIGLANQCDYIMRELQIRESREEAMQ